MFISPSILGISIGMFFFLEISFSIIGSFISRLGIFISPSIFCELISKLGIFNSILGLLISIIGLSIFGEFISIFSLSSFKLGAFISGTFKLI